MGLGPFGKIAIAEIVFYVPIACISFFVAFRHGFNRKLGWLFLLTFSIFRLVGAILTVVYRSMSIPATGLIIAATVLTGIGLSPLLLATHGFVSSITQHVPDLPMKRPLRLVRLLLLAGLILGTVGGSNESSQSQSTINTGKALVRAAIIIFIVVYAFLFLIHVILWSKRDEIPPNFRKLLFGVSLALPPLCIRLIYSVLEDFASTNRFSPIFGEWQFYLFLGLLMEYLVVLVYVITGLTIPIQKDAKQQDSDIPLN